jgi:RNA polymerase sigma-70 factor (ECF subfamily)
MGEVSVQNQDAQLIERCKEGDRSAQEALYNRFASKMMGVCMRYAGDRDVAADMLQEGFIKVFRYLHQFRGDGSVEGWIRRIMVNTALAHLRKQKALQYKVPLSEAEEHAEPATVHQSMNADALMELVQQLPDGYRAVFNLYAIEGYEHQEIAEMLGISEGTSKSQMARARRWLKKNLQHLDHIESLRYEIV